MKEKIIKLNISYVDFIISLINDKVKIENKEMIKNKYENSLKLRYSNVKRVNDRCNKRKELKVVLNNYLEKKNIKVNDYLKVSEKVVLLSSDRKNNLFSVIVENNKE